MASSRYWQKKIDVNYKNEICEVFELAAQHYLPAFFEEVNREGPIHKAIFTFRLTAGDFTAQAQGPTKAEAKLMAARQVLPELRRLPLPPEEERPNFWKKKKKNRTVFRQGLPLFEPHENPVDCLDKLLTNLRGKPAEYTFLDAHQETDPYVVSLQLIAADQTVVALGLSMTDAKRNAAAKMLRIFGYNICVSEPQPKLKEELPCVATESESKNYVLDEVTQGADGTPKEDETSPHQNGCAQPQEQPPAEGPELLPADVLPMLAAMGVIEYNNGKIQWCEPSLQKEKETPAGIVKVTSDISDTFIPDVTCEDATASQELKNGPDVSLDQTPKEEDQTLPVGLLPLKGTEETSLDQAETSLEIVPSNDWDISPEHQQLLEEFEPSMELHSLPAEILSNLSFMGLIVENNGIVEWAEPKTTTTCQEESKDVCSPLQTLPEEAQTSRVPTVGTIMGGKAETYLANVSKLTSEGSGDQRAVSPILDMPRPEGNSISSVSENMDPENLSVLCETEVCDVSRAELVIRPEARYLIPALVQKVFKMAGADNYCGRTLIIAKLHSKIKEQLIVDGQRKLRVKDLDKIGKKAAKRLIKEYGSADAVLRALRDPDTAELEAAIVNHLNTELRAFQNGPKFVLACFSRVRRAFISH